MCGPNRGSPAPLELYGVGADVLYRGWRLSIFIDVYMHLRLITLFSDTFYTNRRHIFETKLCNSECRISVAYWPLYASGDHGLGYEFTVPLFSHPPIVLRS